MSFDTYFFPQGQSLETRYTFPAAEALISHFKTGCLAQPSRYQSNDDYMGKILNIVAERFADSSCKGTGVITKIHQALHDIQRGKDGYSGKEISAVWIDKYALDPLKTELFYSLVTIAKNS